jgi:hypothetical protein
VGRSGRDSVCRAWVRGGRVLLALLAARALSAAAAGGFCGSCELETGIGGTYHFWNTTHGIVLPLTLNFSDGRYELGVFRMATAQSYFSDHFHGVEHNAQPYWGFSAARRFAVLRFRHWRLLLGVGGSYKTEEDILSASHWNFDEQVTVRITPNKFMAIELSARHWSNGGLKLPNHGQDFATLTFTVWSGAW